MAFSIEELIDEIDQADDPGARKQPLPDDALIARYEKDIGFTFPEDYRKFLKSVSNAFVGYISPFTLNESASGTYGDLRVGIAEARKAGVPEDWLPVCEDNGDFYCITPNGRVQFWDHNGSTDESWPDLATWAKEVWLEGG